MTRRRLLLPLALVAAIFIPACSGAKGAGDNPHPTPENPSTFPAPAPSATPEPSPSPSPSSPPALPPEPDADPVIREVPDEQWEAMVDAGVWREGCPLSQDQLRRVEINHIDFDGQLRRGVLIVNADIAESVVRIFTRLFEERFPIRRMEPVELYGGDVNASLRADNTSAYNCRRPDQINAPVMKSPHANGRAIDINPLENPWRDPRCRCWSPSSEFAERVEGPGVILKAGLVWETFTQEGWIWQNIDVPDYMHFDTGYPSKPFTGPSERP